MIFAVLWLQLFLGFLVFFESEQKEASTNTTQTLSWTYRVFVLVIVFFAVLVILLCFPSLYLVWNACVVDFQSSKVCAAHNYVGWYVTAPVVQVPVQCFRMLFWVLISSHLQSSRHEYPGP